MALGRPRLWYLVAAAIALGALQKAPAALPLLGFGLLGLRLSQRWSGFDVRTVTRNRDFRRAFWLALAGTSAWPALQAARHGLDSLRRSHDREMIERFAPDLAEGIRGLPSLTDLMIAGEPWLRVPAFAAALVLPLLLRRPAAILVTSILVAYTMALLLAGGEVYPRYSLIVLPIAAASLAILLLRMPPVPWAGVLAVVLVLGLNGGPAKLAPLRAAATVPPGLAMQVATLKAVGDEMRPGETLIYCRTDDVGRLIPGAVSAYAARGRPMQSARVLLEPGEEPLAGPLRGICPDGALADLMPRLDGFSVAWSRGGYTHWTATGPRP